MNFFSTLLIVLMILEPGSCLSKRSDVKPKAKRSSKSNTKNQADQITGEAVTKKDILSEKNSKEALSVSTQENDEDLPNEFTDPVDTNGKEGEEVISPTNDGVNPSLKDPQGNQDSQNDLSRDQDDTGDLDLTDGLEDEDDDADSSQQDVPDDVDPEQGDPEVSAPSQEEPAGTVVAADGAKISSAVESCNQAFTQLESTIKSIDFKKKSKNALRTAFSNVETKTKALYNINPSAKRIRTLRLNINKELTKVKAHFKGNFPKHVNESNKEDKRTQMSQSVTSLKSEVKKLQDAIKIE